MTGFFDIIYNFLHNMLQLLSFGRKKITNSLNIYIKTNTGSTLSVNLDPKWDIKNVKEFVAPQLGLQPDEVKIIFAGKELSDSTIIEDCDLGQKSILHAVRTKRPIKKDISANQPAALEEEEDNLDESNQSKPMNETLDFESSSNTPDEERGKTNFYVYCAQCNNLCLGKLRVRCSSCKGGAFTVHRDPENWDDVLKSKRITGHCECNETPCIDSETGGPPYTEFYFKCSEHPSGGEQDFAVPLNLVKRNVRKIPCLACTDICDPVLVFPCLAMHVTCIECFRHYCISRLLERQFVESTEIGYTLPCPTGCENSLIEEIHHFKIMTKDQYDRYQRFATEEFVLKSGGVLCPQPGCGMGLLVDEACKRVVCQNGCGFVFCRMCLQGYHLDECLPESNLLSANGMQQYLIDPNRAAGARWEEASRTIIKVSTKPCPKCRTPTERAGGCMHMVCTRAGCDMEWCWVCQTTWTRDCMGAHWFG